MTHAQYFFFYSELLSHEGHLAFHLMFCLHCLDDLSLLNELYILWINGLVGFTLWWPVNRLINWRVQFFIILIFTHFFTCWNCHFSRNCFCSPWSAFAMFLKNPCSIFFFWQRLSAIILSAIIYHDMFSYPSLIWAIFFFNVKFQSQKLTSKVL